MLLSSGLPMSACGPPTTSYASCPKGVPKILCVGAGLVRPVCAQAHDMGLGGLLRSQPPLYPPRGGGDHLRGGVHDAGHQADLRAHRPTVHDTRRTSWRRP
ncbi:MAG TPA: hypothetical protein VF813_06190 [Anaerolineaceae bacterium]